MPLHVLADVPQPGSSRVLEFLLHPTLPHHRVVQWLPRASLQGACATHYLTSVALPDSLSLVSLSSKLWAFEQHLWHNQNLLLTYDVAQRPWTTIVKASLCLGSSLPRQLTGRARNPFSLTCFPLNQFGTSQGGISTEDRVLPSGYLSHCGTRVFSITVLVSLLVTVASLHNLNKILSWNLLFQTNQPIDFKLNPSKFSGHRENAWVFLAKMSHNACLPVPDRVLVIFRNLVSVKN